MNPHILQVPETHWVCPNCTLTDVTRTPGVISRYHSCVGLKGLSAPMVEDGVDCKVEAVEREDFIGNEVPQFDGEGVPIMAIVTTRDEGNDCTVLAPTAAARFI